MTTLEGRALYRQQKMGGEIIPPDEQYLRSLLYIEKFCTEARLNHRFVGGTFTDLLLPSTTASIDFGARKIYLLDYNPPRGRRSDGTLKDSDIQAFCDDPIRFAAARQTLLQQERAARKQGIDFPHPSVESARYDSSWKKRNEFWQIESGIDVIEEQPFFVLDHIKQAVPWETLEPWHIVLTKHGDATFTTFNPFAHALRYVMRDPAGVKRKDRTIKKDAEGKYSKISVMMKFGMQVEQEALEAGLDYRHDIFQSWFDFIRKVRDDQHWRLKLKRTGTRFYWTYPGETISHGAKGTGWLAAQGHRFVG